MDIAATIIVLVFVIGGYFSLKKTARFSQALAYSVQQESIQPILTHIHKISQENRADHFHRAISHFWKGYKRSLAAELMGIFLKEHIDLPIAHFWIQELMSVEPALGKETLSQQLLENDFSPQLAGSCGPVG